MSIVPIDDNDRRINAFDPFSLDLWDPFLDFPYFPSSISRAFPGLNFGASVNSRVDWRESSDTHIFKASLPGFSNEDVLVELKDERVLQISTDSGSFITSFKVPDNAKLDQLKAFMKNGVLTVTIPKEEARRPEVRVVEITGED
ncbi:18.2 kDa class I heat shock protein-like [Humulus lupulus]|uniref:18.2 kDa class I heat shock protein-like n=1 Tax=Humulus lupulus TaxID=3486 RepID=UPI002B404686|nr:18.2 kDa class I heat shock protein-like [Humulus lupulus]